MCPLRLFQKCTFAAHLNVNCNETFLSIYFDFGVSSLPSLGILMKSRWNVKFSKRIIFWVFIAPMATSQWANLKRRKKESTIKTNGQNKSFFDCICPLCTSQKVWKKSWFFLKQDHLEAAACDDNVSLQRPKMKVKGYFLFKHWLIISCCCSFATTNS